ncbi:DUF3332 domain-containing protein [Massilibacteroides vaginae]|uniref:DUF3332 domain-containing protein n=1 Tax=Massilibacteroides vaginae TaxID=1673718 RepID=UPI000A1CA98B|nr:DUF3332 domain-containing protein [Massilibacteroides vaginae]
MKKRSFNLLMAATLASSLMFTSCIGSFGLTNKLLDWNRGVDSKFVNELVFIAFHIVPVYPIAVMADILVINSIEFWSGSNPVADVGAVKTIETNEGTYAIETKADGYSIQKEGEETSVELVYNKEDNSWNVEAEGETHKLLEFKDNDKVVMFLSDGQSMEVELSQAGVLAFQQVVQHASFYAAR